MVAFGVASAPIQYSDVFIMHGKIMYRRRFREIISFDSGK